MGHMTNKVFFLIGNVQLSRMLYYFYYFLFIKQKKRVLQQSFAVCGSGCHTEVLQSTKSFSKLTFLMWRFRKTVPWDGGTYHLKHKVIWVRWFCQQRDQPVELIEGAGPAMNHYQRNSSASLWHLLRLHMQVMDINAWMETR